MAFANVIELQECPELPDPPNGQVHLTGRHFQVLPQKYSHLLNTTEEGAIAPKALVFLGFAINIRFQLSIRMVGKGKKRV